MHHRVPSAAPCIIYGKLCNLPVSFLSDTKSMLRTHSHRYWSLKIYQRAQYSKISTSFSYFPILASWPRKRRLIITTIDNLIFQSRQSSKYIRSNCHLFSLLLSFLVQMYAVAKYVVQFCNTYFRKCPFIWFMSKNRRFSCRKMPFSPTNLELFSIMWLIYNMLQIIKTW